jgi:hypothetical protein
MGKIQYEVYIDQNHRFGENLLRSKVFLSLSGTIEPTAVGKLRERVDEKFLTQDGETIGAPTRKQPTVEIKELIIPGGTLTTRSIYSSLSSSMIRSLVLGTTTPLAAALEVCASCP